jgi:hypothetical protein
MTDDTLLLSNFVSTLTLAEWNLLTNALMTGLMVGYGFWIHHVVKQEEKLKDAAIQALQAALTSKEAEISRLTSDTAPNIVKAYEGMREHADKMTADVMKLQGKIREAKATTEFSEALSEAAGLNLSNRILLEKVGKYMGPIDEPPTPQELWESINDAVIEIDEQGNVRIKKVQGFFDKPRH